MASADATSEPSDSGVPHQNRHGLNNIEIKFSHRGKPFRIEINSDASLDRLSHQIEDILSIPSANQRIIISPRPGLIKPPFVDSALTAADLVGRKINILESNPAKVEVLNDAVKSSQEQSRRRLAGGVVKAATPARSRDWKSLQDSTTFTFLQLKPLPYLPNPERSLRFLERLRDDAGIKATMAKHRWSVPLLTEMNPAEHTTHEGKTLGLNRNAGEVIELRLRTDAYDGYRDYKTIRNTLCHELAHNEFGEHDRNFWDLCHQIEKEVEKGDWKTGGRALTDEEFYESSGSMSEDVADHGGWTGGEYVLGGGTSEEPGARSNTGSINGVSRREVLAKAAEERAKKKNEQQPDGQQ